ncbi:response regulator, partial [Nitrospinae bacterium AH_259_B05_G02_I21]|nr:response regulator [Nitrospinae bacterium AH_259_B05_G02_I21]
CKALRKFLEDKDYEVVEAYDGDQAVALYGQERPDVVLLDVRMPGKDGLETFREIRGFDPEASVIMVTAVHDSEVALQAMEEGAFEY